MNKLIKRRIREFIKNPMMIIPYLGSKEHLKWLSDEKYLGLVYRAVFGCKLDLNNPKSFNEKIQWLKIYDRNPLYTSLVDKYEVKRYVSNLIGEKYLIPTLGVWESFDDIDFDLLPKQFVLKCTHDSGGLVIVNDKDKLNKKSTKSKLNKCLKRNFYYSGREWPYKNVKRRIIAEKYMSDESGIELKDYKIFNFNGEPKLIEVDYDRFINHKRNLYDTEWNYLDAQIKYPTEATHIINRPQALDEMLHLARILSANIPHVRTDFYCIGNKVLFGELTFYHGSGFEKISPEILNAKMGEWIILPERD